MPDRIKRVGWLTSERIAQLDAQAEVFLGRLLLRVDDHGLFEAKPVILRASLYPMILDRVREADIERCLRNCEASGNVRLYAVAGKPYVQILDLGNRIQSKPKFPPPRGYTWVIGVRQFLADEEFRDVDPAYYTGKITENHRSPPKSTDTHGGSPLPTVGHGVFGVGSEVVVEGEGESGPERARATPNGSDPPNAGAVHREANRTLPTTLNTPEFRNAWEVWLNWLAERGGRLPPLGTLDMQLRDLVRITKKSGIAKAIDALEFAMKANKTAPVEDTRGPKNREDTAQKSQFAKVF